MKIFLTLSAVMFLTACATEPTITTRRSNPNTNTKRVVAPTPPPAARPNVLSQTTTAAPANNPLLILRTAGKASQWNEVIELTDKLVSQPSLTDLQLNEVYQNRIRAYESLGNNAAAAKAALEASKQPLLAKSSEGFRLKVTELIDTKLTMPELEDISADSSYGNLRAHAYFKIAEIYLEQKDQDSARRNYGNVISLDSTSDVARRAQDVLSQLEAVRRVEPKTIGVVLPLTGKHASISQKVLRGVQMGLGIYGSNVSSFKLAVVDSEANPDNARRGIERLVKEDNVIAVIGSVLSKNANAVAVKTADLGVPSLALSQKSGITEISPTVFRNALTSEMQVRYLVKTAMEDMGLKRFAVMYPNDQYGIEFANIFWDEVLARGGQITSAQFYSPKETDFRSSIQRLIGTYYIEARQEEYRLRLKEWSDNLPKRTARTTPPDDLLPPVVDFDAVFIPDSAKTLGQISAMLAYNGVRGVHLLGTNLWNLPGLNKRITSSSGPLLFVDSFVTSDTSFSQSQFVRDYKNIFNEEPGIFEIQGYDSGLILRQLISQGNTSRESLVRAISQTKDFPGALGKLSISDDREIYRPLVALTLENGNIVPFIKTSTP